MFGWWQWIQQDAKGSHCVLNWGTTLDLSQILWPKVLRDCLLHISAPCSESFGTVWKSALFKDQKWESQYRKRSKVQRSVHRKYIPFDIFPKRWNFTQFIYCGCWHTSATVFAVPSHPWHQPAAISMNNIRSCKYSQVLLMMGEDIARNMYSWLGINK